MNLPEYTVYLFPYATILFVCWWFFWNIKSGLGDKNRLDWVVKGPKKLLDLEKRGRLSRRDILPMLLITLAAGFLAFWNLGELNAPQTFHIIDADGIVIDLGDEMLIDTVFYYTGGNNGLDNTPHYTLAFSTDGANYTEQEQMLQKHSQTFQWTYASLNPEQELTRYIWLSARAKPLELGELCIVANVNGTRRTVSPLSVGGAYKLFDEQMLIPTEGRTQLNGTIFDEIYHARTAREILEELTIYETTHPPLGKEIIAAGIRMFGMTPFGWRFAGALFGVLMLPLMYLLLKQLFNSSFISFCGTVIWMADFMRFTQTRIATIDTYNVFFVLLMFIFIHRWMTMPKDTPFWKTLPPLFMCGLSFGLGAAAKWSSIYAGFGLIALYLINLYRRRDDKGFIWGTLGMSLVFFIAVPGLIYSASYVPYVRGDFSLSKLWETVRSSQIYMYKYHSRLVDTHPFSSSWYQWVADARPISYYNTKRGGNLTMIMAMNNPLLSWGGMAAIIICAADVFKRKSFGALLAVTGFLSVLLPWVPISRLTFAYHYFPASMFLVVALCYVFWRCFQDAPTAARRRIAAFTAVTVLLFVMFYPVISGTEVPMWYASGVLRWFPSWPIY